MYYTYNVLTYIEDNLVFTILSKFQVQRLIEAVNFQRKPFSQIQSKLQFSKLNLFGRQNKSGHILYLATYILNGQLACSLHAKIKKLKLKVKTK